jgi:AcrR family transcriptional regulator
MPKATNLDVFLPSWALPRDLPLPEDSEIIEKLMKVGLEILTETGLSVGVHRLSLEELASRAEVPPSSVHHLWPTRDAFYADLLVELVQPTDSQGAAFDPETLAVSKQIVEANRNRLGTADGRLSVLLEAIRRGAQRNYEYITNSVQWRTFTALLVSLPELDEPHRTRVIDAIREAEDRFIERMTEFYDEMLPIFKASPRRGLTTRHIAAAGAGVVEGLAARSRISNEFTSQPVALPGIDGDDVDWHLAAVGFAGVVLGMIDLLPDDSTVSGSL